MIFVSTNADLLCDLTIDFLQLALCQPNDSYSVLLFSNQSNVKTSKLLSTKLHSRSVKYAVFDPKDLLICRQYCELLEVIKIWTTVVKYVGTGRHSSLLITSDRIHGSVKVSDIRRDVMSSK